MKFGKKKYFEIEKEDGSFQRTLKIPFSQDLVTTKQTTSTQKLMRITVYRRKLLDAAKLRIA